MTDDERARTRAITRRLRENHRKLFDLQGDAINGLREALTAIQQTHEEMMAFYQTVNDLDDLADEREHYE